MALLDLAWATDSSSVLLCRSLTAWVQALAALRLHPRFHSFVDAPSAGYGIAEGETEKAPDGERLADHSPRAIGKGSMRAFSHQLSSLPVRCRSRWCVRQRGTVNSSLTFMPSALGCAKRK